MGFFPTVEPHAYWVLQQPDHGPAQVKHGRDLKAGDRIILHQLIGNEERCSKVTVEQVNAASNMVLIREWGIWVELDFFGAFPRDREGGQYWHAYNWIERS